MPIDAKTMTELAIFGGHTLLEGQITVRPQHTFRSKLRASENTSITLDKLAEGSVAAIAAELKNNTHIKKIVLNSVASQYEMKILAANFNQRNIPFALVLTPALDEKLKYYIMVNAQLKSHITIVYQEQNADWFFETINSIEEIDGMKQNAVRMSYSYQDQQIAKFVIVDREVKQLEIADDLYKKDFSLIDVELHYAHLMNTILNNRFLQDKPTLLEMIDRYFSGPMPDFLEIEHRPSLTIYVDPIKPYQNELFAMLAKEGIPVCSNPFAEDNHCWLRDNLICLANGRYLISAAHLNLDYKKLIMKMLTINPRSFYQKGMEKDYTYIGTSKNIDTSSMKSILLTNKVKSSEGALLEGGNLITIRIKNTTYVIIGENSRVIIAAYLKQEGLSSKDFIEKYVPSKKPLKVFYQQLKDENYSLQKAHLKEADLVIAEYLNINPKYLIGVPDPAFHIDMVLCSIGYGILIPSFKLVATILRSQTDDVSKKLALLADQLHEIYTPFFAEIKRKLKKHGIPSFKVPGLAYEKDEFGKLKCIANFMNAYVGKGDRGTFFITLTSANKILCEEFARTIKKLGIDNVYYFGSPELTNNMLNIDHGGLRCLSVLGNNFGRFEKVTEKLPSPSIAPNVRFFQEASASEQPDEIKTLTNKH